MQPFEFKKPRIKKEIEYQLTNYLNQKDAIDATESMYIPSERALELWKSDFERTNTIAAGYAYIECNLGRYDNRSISIALQLHKAIATSKAAEVVKVLKILVVTVRRRKAFICIRDSELRFYFRN